MIVIIRKEKYQVFTPEGVRICQVGPSPHLLLFNGAYWERIPCLAGQLEKLVDVIRKAMLRGHSVCNIDGRKGINLSMPRIKNRFFGNSDN